MPLVLDRADEDRREFEDLVVASAPAASGVVALAIGATGGASVRREALADQVRKGDLHPNGVAPQLPCDACGAFHNVVLDCEEGQRLRLCVECAQAAGYQVLDEELGGHRPGGR